MGGLSTAYYLTNEEGWQDRFEVTVYQLGWRLGGKCASSRGPWDRIEEHGIHGFFGCYFNTLGMMAQLYDKLGRDRGAPLATFEEAFRAGNYSLTWEWRGRGLEPWPSRAIPNKRSPRDTGFFKGLQTSVESVMDVLVENSVPGPDASEEMQQTYKLLQYWQKLSRDHPVTEGPAHPLVAAIGAARPTIATILAALEGPPRDLAAPALDERRRQMLALDYSTTLVLGALVDDLGNRGFDGIDGENWFDWLERHGLHPATLRSPMPMHTVNICYQSPNGDTSRLAEMAASSYVDWTLRTYAYLGSYFWSFAAGTGETIIAPLYELLSKRGVKFEFFQKVEGLHLNTAKTAVERVSIRQQVTLKDPEQGYQPLIYPGVKHRSGSPPGKDEYGVVPSWPKTPLYDQLLEGEALQTGDIDLESYWSGWRGGHDRTLVAGKDYDQLVFAMPPGAARHLCGELIGARPEWKRMVEKLPTLQTQAMQVWLKPDAAELGWPSELRDEEDAFSATFMCPPNGSGDLRDLLIFENWPERHTPKALWYICGLMPSYEEAPPFTDTDYPRRMRDRVKAQCIQYLQATAGVMWPRATVQAIQRAGDPVGLDFSLLVDTDDESENPRKGVARFDAQFWRANIDPTELYVAAPPGSGAARLEAGGSGFENLTLAGDWIYTGLNVGSFETSVVSGKLASHALSRSPPLDTIVGYRGPRTAPNGQCQVD
jgi:uncharacterized protein with NAD-binding domain and iron-sulfur cluster